jgi:DNA mismatch repair protein MutS
MSSETLVAASASAETDTTSLLFPGPEEAMQAQEPACFRDLNLDQLVGSILAGREQYALLPVFRQPLSSPESVAFRHEIFRDLEDPVIERAVTLFAREMVAVREGLARADKFYYAVQQQDAFLRAVATYISAVRGLAEGFEGDRPQSRGLTSFTGYLQHYVSSPAFEALSSDVAAVQRGLGAVSYRLQLPGGRVHVSRDTTEEDYAADVAETFARFRQGTVESHLAKLPNYADMNHVEAAIAGLVARLYPQEFGALRSFRERHRDFMDERVWSFDREVQFYLAYLEFTLRIRTAGLPMCYPDLAGPGEGIGVEDGFDPALADHLVSEGKPVVVNDFQLDGDQRLLVVSGPNQGGKTTFARMVGQLTYLASLGLLVPGQRGRLVLPDAILTHFERGENLADLAGALEDDLVRMRNILDTATEQSLVIVNEIFTSTSLEDAVLLSTRVLHQVLDIGCVCVCVTFLDELATLSEGAVSMVSQVDPQDPATRTFKVIRQRADGKAYAEALAEKHGLTYPSLKARLAR